MARRSGCIAAPRFVGARPPRPTAGRVGGSSRRRRGAATKAGAGEGDTRFFPERADGDEPPARDGEADRSGHWVERLGWELAAITGLGGDRTLRELAWAAREKRRFLGELAAWHMAEIVRRIPFASRDPIDPNEANPYRIVRPKSSKLIALEEWQAKQLARARVGLPVELMPKGSI